jgi:hypothetical protein
MITNTIQKNRVQKLMLLLLLLAPQAVMAMNKHAVAGKRPAQRLDPVKQEAMRKRTVARWVEFGDAQLAWDYNNASPEGKAVIESVAVNLIKRECSRDAQNKRADGLLALTKYPQAEGLAQVLRDQGAQDDRSGQKAAQKREYQRRQNEWNAWHANNNKRREEEFKQQKEAYLLAEQRAVEQRAAEEYAAQQRELRWQKEWVDQNFSSALSELMPAGCPPWAIM